MKVFTYYCKNQQGKSVKGEVEAQDVAQVATLLHQKKLVIISIIPKKKSFFSGFSSFFGRVRIDDIVIVTRQLATMIAAGLPITDALHILKSQARASMTVVLEKILGEVEGGASLSDALANHQKIFGQTYISLVRAGESAGVLDDILNRLASTLEKQREFRGKVKGAMIYPVIVVIGMIGVSLIMMIFVVPKLMVMYENFDAELPMMTKVMMGISDFMVAYWYLLFVGAAGLFVIFKGWVSTSAGAHKFDEFLFKIPVAGRLRKFIILTEFSRTMGLLIGAGIAIIEALKITAEAVGSVIYREGLLDAAKQVEKGMPLAVPISQNPYFPPILGQMINVGEETGKVDEVLEKISHYFESESEQGVASLTAAIEPLIMVVLGIGVGILVVSVIMPIYNLTGAL